MVLIEAAFVLGVVASVYLVVQRLLTRSTEPRSATQRGRWVAAHYDVGGLTRVVLEKVSAQGGRVLDEHLVATIPVGDPDYDARFLTAMATARERCALFEAEEG